MMFYKKIILVHGKWIKKISFFLSILKVWMMLQKFLKKLINNDKHFINRTSIVMNNFRKSLKTIGF